MHVLTVHPAYELALQEARKKLTWREDSAKALVMIGDEVPHAPSYTTEKINWWEELDMLVGMGVKVYGVRALNSTHSIPFYDTLSERSGTVSYQVIVCWCGAYSPDRFQSSSTTSS